MLSTRRPSAYEARTDQLCPSVTTIQYFHAGIIERAHCIYPELLYDILLSEQCSYEIYSALYFIA